MHSGTVMWPDDWMLELLLSDLVAPSLSTLDGSPATFCGFGVSRSLHGVTEAGSLSPMPVFPSGYIALLETGDSCVVLASRRATSLCRVSARLRCNLASCTVVTSLSSNASDSGSVVIECSS